MQLLAQTVVTVYCTVYIVAVFYFKRTKHTKYDDAAMMTPVDLEWPSRGIGSWHSTSACRSPLPRTTNLHPGLEGWISDSLRSGNWRVTLKGPTFWWLLSIIFKLVSFCVNNGVWLNVFLLPKYLPFYEMKIDILNSVRFDIAAVVCQWCSSL